MKDVIDSISKLGWAVIASIITLIIYIILERFKNRWSLFTYATNFSSVGTSINDSFYGNIKVLYNDTRVVKHLNFVSLNIHNASNTDFENVIIKCWVDNNSQFLSFDAVHDRYQTPIGLDENFIDERQDRLDEIDEYDKIKVEGEPIPQQITNAYSFLLKKLTWNVPVWNRKDSVTLNFLIENFNGDVPLLMHPIEKKSIRLIEAESAEGKNNRLGRWMIINGYIIYIISSVILFLLSPLEKSDLITFVIVGGLYIWIGLFLYKIAEYIRSFFR